MFEFSNPDPMIFLCKIWRRTPKKAVPGKMLSETTPQKFDGLDIIWPACLFGSPSSFLLGAKSKDWGMNPQIHHAQTRGHEATYVGTLAIKYGSENTSPQLSYDHIFWDAYQFWHSWTNLRFNRASIMVFKPREITSWHLDHRTSPWVCWLVANVSLFLLKNAIWEKRRDASLVHHLSSLAHWLWRELNLPLCIISPTCCGLYSSYHDCYCMKVDVL